MRRGIRIALVAFGLAVATLIGGYALLYRPDIPYAVLDRRYANAQSRFLDLPGGYHLHYRDQGNRAGRAILLIHGFGVSLETWGSWVKLLGGKYRLVSLDLPGHGLTQAPAREPSVSNDAELVAAFARALHLPTSMIVVGNSRGGAVAWNLALRHSHRLAGLVLIDASGFEWRRPPPSGMRTMAALLGDPVLGPLLEKLDKSRIFRQTLAMAYHDKSRVTDAMTNRYIDFSRAPGHRAILDRSIVRSALGDDASTRATPAKLLQIRIPTLILWGAKDEMIDSADAKRFADAIPVAKLIVYPQSGHVPMEEVSEQSAQDLDRWLEGLRP